MYTDKQMLMLASSYLHNVGHNLHPFTPPIVVIQECIRVYTQRKEQGLEQ